MPRARDDYACPGRCGSEVPVWPVWLLACSRCWQRLPDPLRLAVNIAYVRRKHDPVGHRRAVGDAIGWYTDQPAAATIRQPGQGSRG